MLKKINEVKIGNKTPEQKKVVDNLEKFYNSREEDIIFFRDYAKMMLDAGYKSEKDEIKQGETTRAGLKILTPKQMLQWLPIALPQVKKAGNIKWDQINCLFFVSIKRNHWKSMQ